jgi:hypothetical protein
VTDKFLLGYIMIKQKFVQEIQCRELEVLCVRLVDKGRHGAGGELEIKVMNTIKGCTTTK